MKFVSYLFFVCVCLCVSNITTATAKHNETKCRPRMNARFLRISVSCHNKYSNNNIRELKKRRNVVVACMDRSVGLYECEIFYVCVRMMCVSTMLCTHKIKRSNVYTTISMILVFSRNFEKGFAIFP